MSRKQLKAAMDLVRRLPPAKQTKTLAAILSLVPDDDFAEELLADVDQPLKQRDCEQTGRPFIICEYNRDADSFRSPWSNSYCPALDGGVLPDPPLRALEEKLNEIFAVYAVQYYGSDGVSSVYCWDAGEEGAWACAVLFRKQVKGTGTWNSMHILNIQDYTSEKVACYQMTSSVMLDTVEKEGKSKVFQLAGNVAKQWRQYDAPLEDTQAHITNIGNYVQKYENKLRGNLGDIYFGKSLQITEEIRAIRPDVGEFNMVHMGAKPKRKRVWKQYQDEEGNMYWYNTVTGESSWDEPVDKDAHIESPRKEKKEKKEKHAEGGGGMGALAAAAAAKAGGVAEAAPAAKHADPVAEPADVAPKEKKEKKEKKSRWKQVQDDAGEWYWYNSKTGETSWDAPPGEAAPAAEPQTGGKEKPVLPPVAAAVPAPAPAAAATGGRPGPGGSVAEVQAWLRTLGLSTDYSANVQSNAIDGDVLNSLSEADLPEAMGISAFGDKRKVKVAMGW